jgi:RNA polymerase sigma factor (sigma-70 family)
MNLIQDNAKLVYSISNSFHNIFKDFDVEDLAQVGFADLVKSGDKYNPDRGAVSTFITHCVSNAIRRYIKKGAKHKYLDVRHLDSAESPTTNLSLDEYFPNADSLEVKVCNLLSEGYNKVEISRLLKTSIWNINTSIEKIKKRLRPLHA